MSTTPDSAHARPRLLYVEDEVDIAAIAREVLADEYDVAGGPQALEQGSGHIALVTGSHEASVP